jgi:rhodanese-related sulfurtransferase
VKDWTTLAANITRQQLRDRLECGPPLILIEVLGAAYWADAHLPGALNIPANRIATHASGLLPDLEAEIVVYSSATDRNSNVAARRLAALGYRRVRVYAEGKEHWIEHGLPVERADSH